MVVNDAWLTESISYREMRDPEAKRFQVQGSVDPVVPKVPVAAMTRVRIYEDAEQATDQESIGTRVQAHVEPRNPCRHPSRASN